MSIFVIVGGSDCETHIAVGLSVDRLEQILSKHKTPPCVFPKILLNNYDLEIFKLKPNFCFSPFSV